MSLEEKIIQIKDAQAILLKEEQIANKPFRIGSTVKLLTRDYNGKYSANPAIIIGITDFKNLPTIELLYIEMYSGEMKFATFNQNSEHMELAPFSSFEVEFSRDQIREGLVNKVNSALETLRSNRLKLELFDRLFGELVKNPNQTDSE